VSRRVTTGAFAGKTRRRLPLPFAWDCLWGPRRHPWRRTDLLVGCSGGRVVRVDRASGRILAMSTDFSVDQIASITSLGSCSYAREGFFRARPCGSIRDSRCKRFKPDFGRAKKRRSSDSIGNVAILDDRCCFGRAGVYRPATISRVNLLTGDRSPAVDLAPEPSDIPPRAETDRTRFDRVS